MSHTTEEYVHKFWELLDVILNAILFILIAFVLIEIEFNTQVILFGVSAVFVVLISRIIVVNLINFFFLKKSKFDAKTMKIISWGGLRGGLSIALVLSLPNSEIKDTLLVATYFSVLFSIIFQGLTIEKYANRIDRKMKEKESAN
jgi:CPA1 family monovalent cation:H+ antiporter